MITHTISCVEWACCFAQAVFYICGTHMSCAACLGMHPAWQRCRLVFFDHACRLSWCVPAGVSSAGGARSAAPVLESCVFACLCWPACIGVQTVESSSIWPTYLVECRAASSNRMYMCIACACGVHIRCGLGDALVCTWQPLCCCFVAGLLLVLRVSKVRAAMSHPPVSCILFFFVCVLQ